MSKMPAMVGNTLVDARCGQASLLCLRFGQGLLIRAKEARVLNLSAVRVGRELLQPAIYPDRCRRLRQPSGLDLDRETGEPFTSRRARCDPTYF